MLPPALYLETFWTYFSKRELKEQCSIPLSSGDPIHFLFFSGYLNPNHYHLYQLVQLARLQQQSPKQAVLHIVLADVGLHTRRHTGYSVITNTQDNKMNEIYLQQIRSILSKQGVPEENIRLYKFSDLWVQAFNQRKDLLLQFYEGLSEIQNYILEIDSIQSKKFHIPKGGRYTIGYVVQKYGILFLASYFNQLFFEQVDRGKVIPIFGDSGRPIIEHLQKMLVEKKIIPSIPFSLNLMAIPTFGTDKSKSTNLSIPTAGMTAIEIARICQNYDLTESDVKAIYSLFITYVTGRKFSSTQNTLRQFATDLTETFNKLLSQQNQTTEMMVVGMNEIERVGSLLRSSNVLSVLHLCDGSHTTSEIAKVTNKHVSNVSVMIRQLKDANLVEILPTGKPLKTKKSVKIILN